MTDLFTFQQELNWQALAMTARGVAVDTPVLASLEQEVESAMASRLSSMGEFLKREIDETFPRSFKQVKEQFEAFGIKPPINRKTGRPTVDDQALFKIAKKNPHLATFCYDLMEFRQLGQMLSTFIRAKRERDGRLRCSFNFAGPETFRAASSKNVFGRGCNLQNVTTGDRGLSGAKLPNLRRAIVPDYGHILWEPDLAGADAQAVAWDSGDKTLKDMFRQGVKIHAVTAKELYGSLAGPDGKAEPYYTFSKKLRHAAHYLSGPRTASDAIGLPEDEIRKKIARLWAMHPEIPRWHRRVKQQLHETRTITNAFGYRIVYFGRIDDVLPDAVAWIGQGTVACVMNRAFVGICEHVPNAIPLMNEHDSTVGETLIELWPATKPLIREQFEKVVVPYPDPLVIPAELKTSLKSWGNMEKEPWA